MPGLSGREIKVAVKKAATWNTAVACGANDGVVLLPTSIKRDATFEIDDSMGRLFSIDGIPGPVKVEGDAPAYLRYDSLDLLFAMYMGTAGAPTLLGSGAYSYTYKVKTLLDGLFFTLVKNMKNYIDEYPSCKVTGFTIKGDVGKPLQVTFNLICVNKVVSSTVNTLATFTNVTFFEEQNRINFTDGVIRINAQSGAALGSGDTVYPAAFEVSSKRKLAGEYTAQYKTPTVNQELIDEPAGDGIMETTLKLTFPRHTSSAYLADIISDARKKMDMTFTGALIGGTYYRLFKLQFPNLQLKNVDVVDADGNIKEPLELIAHGCLTAPTGMTGLTDPFWISGQNRRTTDPLA